MGQRINCWFSCGAASAVATKLVLAEKAERFDVRILYCETGSEHEDNERFIADCERWFGQSILRLKNPMYQDTFDVWHQRKYISGPNGAPCTRELKFIPRLDYQLPSDQHVWGYTADKADVKRAERMLSEYPNMHQRNPLIERNLTKANVLALVQSAGIELPAMYRLGFHNNNCKVCCKSTSPAYYALSRKCFPKEFYAFAGLCRQLGVRPIIIGTEIVDGKRKNIRIFPDELPMDTPTNNPIAPACDFLCHFAEQEIAA